MPRPMNAPVGRSLAPFGLPVNNELVRVAPADFRKSRRPEVLWVISIWLALDEGKTCFLASWTSVRGEGALSSSFWSTHSDGGSFRFAVIPAKRSASRNPACFPGDGTFLLPSSAEEGRALARDGGPTPAPGWCDWSLRRTLHHALFSCRKFAYSTGKA